MPRFRHRPIEVEAVQWTGTNWDEIVAAFGAYLGKVTHDPDSRSLLVNTEEGRMQCRMGSWLVRDANGTFYPHWDAGFQTNYELLPHTSPEPSYYGD